MTTYYLDWSLRNGVTGVKDDDDTVQHWPKGTDEFLNSLTGPTRIVMESTVHSFVREWRDEFIARCDREGHDLRFTTPRETGRWSRQLNIEKSDFNDPFVIREIARRGGHLKKPSVVSDDFETRRAEANHELMLLRATGKKDEFAAEVIDKLPPYSSLDDTMQRALGDGKKYSKVIFAAVAMAAKHARNRNEFDRICGLYAHGYGQQVRADLYHYGWSGGAKRGRLNGKPTGFDKKGRPQYGIRKRDDLTLSDYRRSLRWAYHQVKT